MMYQILAGEAPFQVRTFVRMAEARGWLGLRQEGDKA
jgi:hypothetical protein